MEDGQQDERYDHGYGQRAQAAQATGEEQEHLRNSFLVITLSTRRRQPCGHLACGGGCLSIPLFLDDVAEQPDAAVLAFFGVHALDLVGEPGEVGVAVLERLEVGDHRRGVLVPALAGHHDADARRARQQTARLILTGRSDSGLPLIEQSTPEPAGRKGNGGSCDIDQLYRTSPLRIALAPILGACRWPSSATS